MLDRLKPSKISHTTFIYALLDPCTNDIRYIGKADDPELRLKRHIAGKREKNHKAHWIGSLLSKGLRPSVQIVDEVLRSEWQAAEAAYIIFFKEEGCNLTNGTLGGEGCGTGEDNPGFGKPRTPEVRVKLSEISKGKKLTPEQREKFLSVIKSPESRAKHSEIAKNRRPETVAKMIASQNNRTPEWLSNMSTAQKNLPSDKRMNIIAAHRTPEYRTKMIAVNKNRTPEHRAIHLASVRTPEYREKKRAEWSIERRLQRAVAMTGKKMTSEQLAKQSASLKATWTRRKAAQQSRQLLLW